MLEKFNENVLNGTGTIMVKFGAPWCSPCKQLEPILEQVRNEGYHIFEVNTDENKELIAKYNVRSVPTLIVFKDGQIVNTLVGIQTKNKIIEVLTNV